MQKNTLAKTVAGLGAAIIQTLLILGVLLIPWNQEFQGFCKLVCGLILFCELVFLCCAVGQWAVDNWENEESLW